MFSWRQCWIADIDCVFLMCLLLKCNLRSLFYCLFISLKWKMCMLLLSPSWKWSCVSVFVRMLVLWLLLWICSKFTERRGWWMTASKWHDQLMADVVNRKLVAWCQPIRTSCFLQCLWSLYISNIIQYWKQTKAHLFVSVYWCIGNVYVLLMKVFIITMFIMCCKNKVILKWFTGCCKDIEHHVFLNLSNKVKNWVFIWHQE